MHHLSAWCAMINTYLRHIVMELGTPHFKPSHTLLKTGSNCFAVYSSSVLKGFSLRNKQLYKIFKRQ